MNIMIVDDEPLLVKNTTETVLNFNFVKNIYGFTSPTKALEFIKTNKIHIALLDIEMPAINGLELAKKIHKLSPDTCIIFITSYSQYALDAFSVDAIAYLLKPFTESELEKALKRASTIVNHNINNEINNIQINTFDGFDVYINDKILYFPRQKSKELLALLVDHKGASLTAKEAMAYLWEDKPVDDKLKENFKKCSSTLKKVVKEMGIEHILNIKYNNLSINTSAFNCDYYDFLNGDPKALRLYHGVYMPNYSWAEETNAKLYFLSQKKITF
jgi:two-component SAPR family response regulator